MNEREIQDYRLSLVGMAAGELVAEVATARVSLAVLERFPPALQEGHSVLMGRPRLAERELLKRRTEGLL